MARLFSEEQKDAYAASELSEFIIHDLQATGNTLGNGAYAIVEELDMNGTRCAGKRIHEVLLDHEIGDRIGDRIILECKMTSKLRHPHIVQFLGVFYPVGSRLPTLVMEKMEYTLQVVLERTVNIGFAAKIAILHDVSKGLVYLHKCNILHRNLTATDILLNSAMIVKISDFTVSRILPQGMATMTMTQCPGAVVYMPPEALEVHPHYGSGIDTFSFGVICLFTAIQEFPCLLEATYLHHQTLMARSEVERRAEYMEELRHSHHDNPSLELLIESCLRNDPEQRPAATRVLQEIVRVKQELSEEQIKLDQLELQKSLLGIQHEANPLQKALFKELKPYSKNVHSTGTSLGAGAHGEVIEVRCGRQKLAAKSFHKMGTQDADTYIETFCRMVVTLLKLQHQNILKYEGICFLSEEHQIPSLLMERMSISLRSYLILPENKACTLGCKAAILRDVANGLNFLHSQTPAIIHRDLTATNVLLDDKLTAKIADFGNARIVDLNPLATPQTITSHLGTALYMPPETLQYSKTSEFSVKLDIFSFGHLTLFTIVQEDVCVLAPTYTDQGKLKPRSEVERRVEHRTIARQMLGDHHLLTSIATQCLDNDVIKRPSASTLYEHLDAFANQLQDKKLGKFKPFLFVIKLTSTQLFSLCI